MDNKTEKKPHLLVVDDDAEIRQLLGNFLRQYQFHVSLARDGQEMFKLLQQTAIDLIILDIMLPGEDGFALCRKLRTQMNIPIIMLTAIDEEADRIIGLELGADDYLAKPFNPRELLARIKAILRRTERATSTNSDAPHHVVQFDHWQLDLDARRLVDIHTQNEINLSSGEYELLAIFIQHPRRILSRDLLIDLTRHRPLGPFDRTIDVQVSRLRHKIEEDHKNPSVIKTVRNGGYIFTADVKNVSTDAGASTKHNP